MSKGGDKRPIVIRRKKVVHAHHGGAWKIALADFMTALMALFLVMWILSVSDDETRRSVAEYFSTPLITAMTSGDRSGSTQVIPVVAQILPTAMANVPGLIFFSIAVPVLRSGASLTICKSVLSGPLNKTRSCATYVAKCALI